MKENVIWFFGDQHRAQAVGCAGDPNLNTPNIDAFAAEGINIAGAVSGCPLCCPFRGSLLSGQYSHKSVPGHEHSLPEKQQTVAHCFNDFGYDTAYFGKWHLDGFKESNGRAAYHVVPQDRRGGFKHWVGYENNNAPFDCWVHGSDDRFKQPTRLPGYETDSLTDLLIEYLSAPQRKQKPFFSVLSVQPPHDPYTAPEEWMQRHTPGKVQLRPNVPESPSHQAQARRSLAGYYSMIENLDWNFGRILRVLETTGLIDNTHVFFFSDHGDMHGSHGQQRKTTFYEESVRVPCYYRYGRNNYAHRNGKFDWVFNHVDYSATSLGLCGLSKGSDMQGFDYSGIIQRKEPLDTAPESAFIQIVKPTCHPDSVNQAWRGIITRDGWKYACMENQHWLMFDLNNDPYEQANLVFNVKYKSYRNKLHHCLAEWLQNLEDDFSLPTP